MGSAACVSGAYFDRDGLFRVQPREQAHVFPPAEAPLQAACVGEESDHAFGHQLAHADQQQAEVRLVAFEAGQVQRGAARGFAECGDPELRLGVHHVFLAQLVLQLEALQRVLEESEARNRAGSQEHGPRRVSEAPEQGGSRAVVPQQDSPAAIGRATRLCPKRVRALEQQLQQAQVAFRLREEPPWSAGPTGLSLLLRGDEGAAELLDLCQQPGVEAVFAELRGQLREAAWRGVFPGDCGRERSEDAALRQGLELVQLGLHGLERPG